MKTTQILKAILIGAVAGAAIFFVPFPFRFFFIFFFLFFIIRAFAWRRRSYGKGNYNMRQFWNPSYTQRWQSMSDEERKAFMQKMESELFATKTSAE